jgi:hypothetical protein
MTMPENPYYKRFLAAFSFLLDKEWKRRQKALAIDVGVSPEFISDIKNEKSIAGDEIQAVFAERMGYPNFDEFIALGRSLIETGKPLEPKSKFTIIASNTAHQDQKSNVIELTRNKKDADPTRLSKMIDDLKEIYNSNNGDLVAAIEADLTSFRATVELLKKVSAIEKQLQSERKARELLMEENEALKNRLGDKK